MFTAEDSLLIAKGMYNAVISACLFGEGLFPIEDFVRCPFHGSASLLILKCVAHSNRGGITDVDYKRLSECDLVQKWIRSIFKALERQDLKSATFFVSSLGVVRSITCHFHYFDVQSNDNGEFDVTEMVQKCHRFLGVLAALLAGYTRKTDDYSFGMELELKNMPNCFHDSFPPFRRNDAPEDTGTNISSDTENLSHISTPHFKMTLTSTIVTRKNLTVSSSLSAMTAIPKRAVSENPSLDEFHPALKRKNAASTLKHHLSSYSVVVDPIRRPGINRR